MEGNYSRILEKIDEDELIELALTLGKIQSPRGHEAEAGDFVFKWMEENGFSPFKQEVCDNRFNVVGVLREKERASA